MVSHLVSVLVAEDACSCGMAGVWPKLLQEPLVVLRIRELPKESAAE